MIRPLTKFSIVAMMGCLAGCATQDLRRDITKLERNVNDLRSFQVEQADTINSLDGQIKALAGRIEQMEFSQNKRIGTDLNSLRDDVSSLRRRVPPPSIVPAAELDVDEVWGENLPVEAKRLFLDGLQRLREGKFADALPLLQNASEQLQGSDKAGVPLFWEGVAYDGLGDDKGALRSYAEVVSRYGRSPRAPTSLLRQSTVLLRLGDRKTAALTLEKLVADYQKSPEWPKAKERLKEMR